MDSQVVLKLQWSLREKQKNSGGVIDLFIFLILVMELCHKINDTNYMN